MKWIRYIGWQGGCSVHGLDVADYDWQSKSCDFFIAIPGLVSDLVGSTSVVLTMCN